MLQAVDHAVHVFRGDRAAWQIIQKNGMEQASPVPDPDTGPDPDRDPLPNCKPAINMQP